MLSGKQNIPGLSSWNVAYENYPFHWTQLNSFLLFFVHFKRTLKHLQLLTNRQQAGRGDGRVPSRGGGLRGRGGCVAGRPCRQHARVIQRWWLVVVVVHVFVVVAGVDVVYVVVVVRYVVVVVVVFYIVVVVAGVVVYVFVIIADVDFLLLILIC